MRVQRLWPRGPAAPADIAGATCGLQAQDAAASALSVRVRSEALTARDLDRAVRQGDVVRTWCMRGTIHLLAAEDLSWLVALLGPVATAASARRRAQLGLDDRILARVDLCLREALTPGTPLTRHELNDRFAEDGIRLEGQALIHAIRHAALQGTVRIGPPEGRQDTYVLTRHDAGAAGPMGREPALARLARRYLAAFGPATLHDFAAWSGLGKADARAGWEAIAGQTLELTLDGAPARILAEHEAWLDEEPAEQPVVRLLPAFDTYLLGHASRDAVINPEHVKQLHPGGGIIRPAVVVDGRVVGTWKLARKGGMADVAVEPFEAWNAEVGEGVEREAARITG